MGSSWLLCNSGQWRSKGRTRGLVGAPAVSQASSRMVVASIRVVGLIRNGILDTFEQVS